MLTIVGPKEKMRPRGVRKFKPVNHHRGPRRPRWTRR